MGTIRLSQEQCVVYIDACVSILTLQTAMFASFANGYLLQKKTEWNIIISWRNT